MAIRDVVVTRVRIIRRNHPQLIREAGTVYLEQPEESTFLPGGEVVDEYAKLSVMDQLGWQKSSFSGGGEGACVELAPGPAGHVRLRESDRPDEIATVPPVPCTDSSVPSRRTPLSSVGDLALRPWRGADAAAVLAAFAAPGMERQADDPVDSHAAASRWIARRAAERDAGAAYAFAVVDEDGTALGNASVSAVNPTHGTGWVSYWTTPPARGRGVATYACSALARWAFEELSLFRLELGHRTNNPASCRVARAAGFAAEGLQRQKLAYDGVRYDVELHARLASDRVSFGDARRPESHL